MKKIKIFSALLLLSTTIADASLVFQRTVYADTTLISSSQVSSENYENGSTLVDSSEQATDSSTPDLDSSKTTEQSSDAATTEESQSRIEDESSTNADYQNKESTIQTEESHFQESESEKIAVFDTAEDTVSVLIEGEAHLRAVLLGEIYTYADGEQSDYSLIANDTQIRLVFAQNLSLSAPITDVQRTNLQFTSETTPISISQSSAENLIQLGVPADVTWKDIQLQGIISPQGLMQTTGASTILFEDTSMTLTTTTGQISNNSESALYFSGSNVITTATTQIPTMFIADSVVINDSLTITHSSSNATPMFEGNTVQVAENANFSVTRSTNSNTGTVFHLTGTNATIQFDAKSQTTIRQSGAFISLPNTNQDSRLTVATDALLDVGTGNGLSGNTTSTLGEVVLESGSQLVMSEYGTVTATPAVNVGYRFIAKDSTSENPTIIKGTRTGTTTGAFIQIRSANSEVYFGENTNVTVSQQGPMITALATTTVEVADYAVIDNTHSFGFTGSVAVQSIAIGDHVQLTLNEPSNATVSTSYATFLAQDYVTVGDYTQISAPRTRTTTSGVSTAFVQLTGSEGNVQFGKETTIVADQRGPFLTASLAEVIFDEGSKLTGNFGQGFTAGTQIKSFTMKDSSTIVLTEHTSSSNVVRFSVRDSFTMADNTTLSSNRTSTGTADFLALTAANSSFKTGNNVSLNVYQVGPIINGIATTDLIFGEKNEVTLTTGHGMTSNSGAVIRSLDIGKETNLTITEHTTTASNVFILLRDEFILRENAQLKISRPGTRTTANIRLTRSSSKFTTLEGSKLQVDALGPLLRGTTTTDVVLGDRSETIVNTAYGFTGNVAIRSFTTGTQAKVMLTEPTTGSTSAVSLSVPAFRVRSSFVLGEETEFVSERKRTTSNSRLILINTSNSEVKIGKNATMTVDQQGGIFQPHTSSNFTMEEGAVFDGTSGFGFTVGSSRFGTMTIGKNANFSLTDSGRTAAATALPLVAVVNTINVMEDAEFVLETNINRSQLIYFYGASANLNMTDVTRFELIHPNTRAGTSNATLQSLIRSNNNAVATGLRINFQNQKVSLWQNVQEDPSEEFLNVSGTLRINRNNNVSPGWSFNGTGRSQYLSVETVDGTVESTNFTDFTEAIAKNNYRRMLFSEPEGLVARIDDVSDQSTEITGSMFEDTDVTTITYVNTAGETVTLDKDSSRIEWGDYRDENEIYRYFSIPLRENERLETETSVEIFLSKPSIESYVDMTTTKEVIKGVDYEVYNITLDRFKINELDSVEELYALIIEESRATAANVLTEDDMTDDFRVVETDVMLDVEEDGTYYAVLEVGNKAYQVTVGIDITSKLEHMRVTIPTKMIFESLYDTAESNRNFESEEYQIQNHSQIPVETYINQMAIDDASGIVLLAEGEDPLDYAESESEEDDPEYTLEDISTPLLQLNLKTEENEIQLYEQMKEIKLMTLAEKESAPISLTGVYYGDYPQWIEDSELEQGGYYEDMLVPNYRIILRFVPK